MRARLPPSGGSSSVYMTLCRHKRHGCMGHTARTHQVSEDSAQMQARRACRAALFRSPHSAAQQTGEHTGQASTQSD